MNIDVPHIVTSSNIYFFDLLFTESEMIIILDSGFSYHLFFDDYKLFGGLAPGFWWFQIIGGASAPLAPPAPPPLIIYKQAPCDRCCSLKIYFDALGIRKYHFDITNHVF